jgi:hypothetical protein
VDAANFRYSAKGGRALLALTGVQERPSSPIANRRLALVRPNARRDFVGRCASVPPREQQIAQTHAPR